MSEAAWLAGGQPFAGRLDADQRAPASSQEGVEDAHGVGAAADAGHHRVGQAADRLEHLLARLVADHALEVAHHHRVRVRPGDGADDVVGVARRW